MNKGAITVESTGKHIITEKEFKHIKSGRTIYNISKVTYPILGRNLVNHNGIPISKKKIIDPFLCIICEGTCYGKILDKKIKYVTINGKSEKSYPVLLCLICLGTGRQGIPLSEFFSISEWSKIYGDYPIF